MVLARLKTLLSRCVYVAHRTINAMYGGTCNIVSPITKHWFMTAAHRLSVLPSVKMKWLILRNRIFTCGYAHIDVIDGRGAYLSIIIACVSIGPRNLGDSWRENFNTGGRGSIIPELPPPMPWRQHRI